MRLLLPSLIIAAYLLFSLVRPMNLRLRSKFFLGALLFSVSLKYIFYEVVGGSFFRPELPVPVLLAAEALYASLVVLFFLALIKDGVALLCWLFRCVGIKRHLPFSPEVRASLLVLLALCSGAWGSAQAVRVPEVPKIFSVSPDVSAAESSAYCSPNH